MEHQTGIHRNLDHRQRVAIARDLDASYRSLPQRLELISQAKLLTSCERAQSVGLRHQHCLLVVVSNQSALDLHQLVENETCVWSILGELAANGRTEPKDWWAFVGSLVVDGLIRHELQWMPNGSL